jgi:hypothetical protein
MPEADAGSIIPDADGIIPDADGIIPDADAHLWYLSIRSSTVYFPIVLE